MRVTNSVITFNKTESIPTNLKRLYPNTSVFRCYYIKVKPWFCTEYVVPDTIIDFGLPPLGVPVTSPFFISEVRKARPAPYRGSRIKLWYMNRFIKHITSHTGYVSYLDNDNHLDYGCGSCVEEALQSSRRFKS